MSIADRTDVAELSAQLQDNQKSRSWYIKSRIMLANRLQATVACEYGDYKTALAEKERIKAFAEAGKIVKQIVSGEIESPLKRLVMITQTSIDAFEEQKKLLDKQMKKLAEELPVADWVEQPEQRGFGFGMLSVLIGETGDLHNYSNPGKMWKRMGCAPFTKDGMTLMGATWRSRSKQKIRMSASDWEDFGYSPKRRSIAYLVGEGLLKQNGDGPYRERYNVKKAEMQARNTPEEAAKPSKDRPYTDQRCHRHGMLLATKMLMKNLWIEWTGATGDEWTKV